MSLYIYIDMLKLNFLKKLNHVIKVLFIKTDVD